MKRRSFLVAGGLTLIGGGLAGCETPNPGPTFPPLSFTDRPGFALPVASIEVQNTYAPPLATPNVEHLMPVAPGPGAERWALDVMKASGVSGVARLVIAEASVVEVPLQKTQGVKGLFTVDQDVRYDGRLSVRLEIIDTGNIRRAQVLSTVERSQTVAEDVTPNQRARVWYDFTLALIDQLDIDLRARAASTIG